MAHPCVAEFFRRTPQGAQLAEQLAALSAKEVYVLLCLPAMGQEHVLSLLPPGELGWCEGVGHAGWACGRFLFNCLPSKLLAGQDGSPALLYC